LKRLVGLVLATFVAVSIGSIASGAAPRPIAPKTGATCSPLGKVQVVGTKKFTCVKSGKKLVWNKPVTVKKPTPSPTPTCTPVAKPSLESLDAKAVYDFSRASVTESLVKNGTSALSVKYLVGANVSGDTVDSVKLDLQKAIDLWGTAFASTDRVTIIWYVQPDLDWAAATYRSESGNPVEWSSIKESCTLNFCGNATATIGRNGTFIFEQGMMLDRSGWNKATAGHEFTHLAQNKLAGSNVYSMPLWLIEGSAQFYGEATGYFPADTSKSIRKGMHRQFASDARSLVSVNFQSKTLKEVLSSANPSNTVQLMNLIEVGARGSSSTALAYLLGSYASEVLVSVYGHDKFVELYKSFETSSDWESNFQKVYGMPTTTFYEKLTPYLAQVMDEL
jgi:hypothetical protein